MYDRHGVQGESGLGKRPGTHRQFSVTIDAEWALGYVRRRHRNELLSLLGQSTVSEYGPAEGLKSVVGARC